MKIAIAILLTCMASQSLTAAPPASQPSTTTQSAPKPAPSMWEPVLAILKRMPENLQPAKDETKGVQTLRQEWIEKNLTTKTIKASGKVISVTPDNHKIITVVELDAGTVELFGKSYPSTVSIRISYAPESVLLLKKGDTYSTTMTAKNLPSDIYHGLKSGSNLTTSGDVSNKPK